MKAAEKQLAKTLRAKGWPLSKIQAELGVSKSSVSVWVRDIELTQYQKDEIYKGRFTRSVIERTRQTRLLNENARRQIIIDRAREDVPKIDKQNLRLIGTALYWAEGGKTMRGMVRFSNSDPEMIAFIMRFFREACKAPEEKFRVHLHIHHHLDYKKAEQYWSRISRIPLTQFYKTYRKPNKSSKNKKDSLPYGTCDIYVLSTELFLKIKGWTEGIKKATIEHTSAPFQSDTAAVAQW